MTLENPFVKEKKQLQLKAGEVPNTIGLLKVTRNCKTGDFEVIHGHPGDEETSLNRIWRVVGNRNDQLQ